CTDVPRLCALDPGQMQAKWCQVTPSDPLLPVVVAGDGTLYAPFPGAVIAFAPADGKLLWSAALPRPARGVALALDGAVIAADAGHVSALSPVDGHARWSVPRWTLGDVIEPSIGIDGAIYFYESGAFTRAVAIDPVDGHDRWAQS